MKVVWMMVSFLVLALVMSGCVSTEMQKRFDVLDVENVRLTSENNALKRELSNCQTTMKDSASRLRRFQGILGNTLKLQEEAEERAKIKSK